jgi:acetyl-CoA acetyltransferase
MSDRNPMKDAVAIVGVGATPYARDLGRTPIDLGLEAATKAIEDAGIGKAEIDGICGGGWRTEFTRDANFLALQEGLGIESCAWQTQARLGSGVLHAAHALFSGACDVALVVQAYQLDSRMSQSAGKDPYRVRASEWGKGRGSMGTTGERWFHNAENTSAWANRYMHEYDVPRDVFGMIAVNNRSNASRNDEAVLRTPITMEDYLTARPVRAPLGRLDFDFRVDCAEAMVLTTSAKAKTLPSIPVFIHAATFGQSAHGCERYENGRSWTELSPWIAMPLLWRKSDIHVNDLDICFPYDGASPVAVNHVEAAGFCDAGGAWAFFQEAWDADDQRLKLNGKTFVTTNGGSMSHGESGGMNSFRESVTQLRGKAGERQVAHAQTALVTMGSFYHDTVGVVLRSD